MLLSGCLSSPAKNLNLYNIWRDRFWKNGAGHGGPWKHYAQFRFDLSCAALGIESGLRVQWIEMYYAHCESIE